MPIDKEFNGNGNTVMSKMVKSYGPERGKKVFFATLQKRGELKKSPSKRPTFGGKRSF
jgi:hypothetical protein